MKNNPIEKIRDLLAEPEARRKAAICAGLAAALAVGGAGIAIASNRPEPIDSTPSAVEKAGAESVAPADIAKICPTLTLDGQDVGAPADEVTVTTGKGRVFVTQRAGDDAAATVDSTARRSAALARSLDGCETGGKTIETVTWAAVDEGGNVQVAVTNSPAAAPSGGTTAEVVNGSGGHVISDGVWNSDGVHDAGYEQNAGTVTDSAGGKIEAGAAPKADEGDKSETAEDGSAKIYNEKCVACGACVYQCPFGAIMDKSFILDAIDIIKKSEENTNYKTFAVVAPSISSQFTYAKLGQVITGLKKLGFHTVIEAALGADMVAMTESAELVEKGFLTSSCCPAFVSYIKKSFPDLIPLISHNPSPMAAIAKYLKETDSPCKVVFIGPCTAKKAEAQLEEVKSYVDCVLTFEELQALFDSKDIDITALEEDVLDNASYFGRIFARSGGLADAVAEALKETGHEDFALNPAACDGIEACRAALMKKSRGLLKENFIEGMACSGGCIGGAGCLTHGEKNKAEVDKYGKEAYEKTISDAVSILKKN